MVQLALVHRLKLARVWIPEAALRHLILLVKDLDIMVQVRFLIIQLVHFPLEIMADLYSYFLLDFALNTSPMLARHLALILAITLN